MQDKWRQFRTSAIVLLGLLSVSLGMMAQTGGTPWAWGYNGDGEFGNGTTDNSNVPMQVPNLTNVIAFAGGAGHSLMLKNDGTLWACGWNVKGQLGDGTTTDSDVPVLVSGLTGVKVVGAGWTHSLAIKSDGTVWAWGYNNNGELGDGGTEYQSDVPVQVSNLSGATALAGGEAHSLALKSDGTVWACGANNNGQLGDGTNTQRDTPVQVLGLTEMIAIAGGRWDHSVALKNDGTVWAWGLNSEGQLGDGTNNNSNVPVQVSGLTNVTAIAGGQDHCLALKSDGSVWAWGRNAYGQLGNGTTTSSNVPVQATSLTGVAAIACGDDHSLALRDDGTVWAWGYNIDGELGNGTNVNRNAPVQVSGLAGVSAVAAGGSHSLALKAPAVPPPVVSSMAKMGSPFRIIVNGSNLQSGVQVSINGSPWPNVMWKSTSKLKIMSGASLKAAVPKGTPTNFTFVNPDGGTATVAGWSW